MNTIFKKEKLDDITYEVFEMAAFAAMTSGYESIGLGGYPAGEDFILYGEEVDGHRQSEISLNNWCGYLTMLITDRKGSFLFYGHINGVPAKRAIRLLYDQFLAVKDLVDTETELSFPKQNIGGDALEKFHHEWEDVERKVREYFAEHPEEKEKKK